MKANCWEVMACGRGPGGARVSELGPCPAATDATCDGLNGGTNGGRMCWAVSGTFCGGKVQGTFADKEATCAACVFFNRVRAEEGVQSFFATWKKVQARLARKNCWDYMQCGRGPGGEKVSELGVCPAASEAALDGLNNGTNGGRMCWALTGTFCGGTVQGTFAEKEGSCMKCAFYQKVRTEEGEARFLLDWRRLRKQHEAGR
ncbi:MAG: two-CW domain-containing protein [Candidatus Latescibacterota bacterium]